MNINESTYSDYMLIIAPPAEVEQVINQYKRATARVIGSFDGLYGKAHITVANQHRQMPNMMIQKLGCYQKPISRLKAIPMYVNGFAFFKHGNSAVTVYAKIELNTQVNNWFTHLKRIFGDKTKTMVPHITIAKNIPADLFRVLWPNYIDKKYQHCFTPQSITVLSRPMIGGRDHYWVPFKELYFNNFD
jgi:2'-5' RNA ligase